MKVGAAIRAAAERLAETSPTPRLDAEYLMALAAKMPRSDVWRLDIDGERVPDGFDALVERRLAREPLAHILGNQEFFGRIFRVTKDVLIPRSDSETLIYVAKELAPHAPRVIDLGTGSGALLVTALLEIEGASGVAIDASQAALVVAENNAQTHRLGRKQAKFFHRNWHDAGWADDLGTFDLILCNPPYVEDNADLDPDVRDYEPAEALFAGEEGLDDYRVIIPQLGKLLNEAGGALLEIGHTQGDAVRNLAESAGFSVEIRNDLANRPRCVILR